MKTLKIILASILVFTFVFSAQAATILRVPSQYQTIQAAIDAASNGDTVRVARGTYRGAGNKDLDFRGKAITLESEDGPAYTIIDCEGIGRAFYFHSGESSLSVVNGFTIKNGSPGGYMVQIALNPQTGEKSVHVDAQTDILRPENDGDPAVESGEAVGFDIALKNNSSNPVNNVSAILRSADTRVKGLIPTYTGTGTTSLNEVQMVSNGIPVNYGTIYGNSTRSMFFQFVKINDNFRPLGDRIHFTLEIKSDGSFISNDEFDITVGANLILDRVDVDDRLKPGAEDFEDVDIRLKNITSGNIESVRVDIRSDSRSVDIEEERIDFVEIRAGRVETATFQMKIDEGFSGYVHFTLRIEANRTLVNIEAFTCYFGMRTQYITHWIVGDDSDNRIAEAGESIELQIVRWNPTDKLAEDVESVLDTTDSHITMTKSDGDYRDISAHSANEARREYEFDIADTFAGVANFDKQGYTAEFSLDVDEAGESMGKENFTMRIGGIIRYLSPEGYDDLLATIDDSASLGQDNNGNGIPEPGEIIEIEVTLINISEVDNVDDVEAELDSDDDVRFIVDYGEYGDIRKRGKKGSEKFRVKIDEDFEGTRILFTLDIKGRINGGSRDNLGKDTFTIPVQNRGVNFESTEITTSVITTVTDSTKTVTYTDGNGGAISCMNSSSPTIKNCIITRNSATSSGGGIFCSDSSSPILVNNVINSNLAGTYGGGISCNNSSAPTIVNNTIVGNSAGTTGGGIRCQNSSFPTVINTILWGNTSNEIYIDSGSVIDITYSDILGSWPGSGNINANPRFVNAASDDYHLMDSSPCINAGTTAPKVPDMDIEARPRSNPPGSKPDIGAYESPFPALPLTVTSVTPSSGVQGATGLDITINGTNFISGASVSFSGTGITVVSTTFVNSTKLITKINISPTAPSGARNVIVTNPGGQMAIGNNMFQVAAIETSAASIQVEQTVGKGVLFPAKVNVERVSNLAGFQIDISFNPAILEAVKAEQGTFLAAGGSVYWPEPSINNTAGTIGIVSARTSAGGANGNGTLATITFKSKATGESYIRFKKVVLSDSKGGSVPFISVDTKVNVTGTPSWDTNKDGKIDIFDLVLVAQHIGETITTPISPNPDIDGDGVVTISDLVLVGQHFGEPFNAASPSRDIWSFDPQYLPLLTRTLNMMEDSPSSEPGFLTTKELLRNLISKTRVSKAELFQNYPNPFNPETWIPFQISESANVEIRIHNAAGKLIRVLDLGYRNAGYYKSQADSARWDGTDENGEMVASGVYFYSIKAGQFTATRKMMIVK